MFDASKVSPLGFGCMRFDGRETNEIDFDQVSEMIDCYMEAGGNYFDTAWAYPNSEVALRECLVKRHPRDSFMIATKCIAWAHCESQADLEKQLQESLENLGVSYVDVYLMHNLGGKRTAAFEAVDAWGFMKSVKERGLAKHIGFSAHCTPDELRGLIADYPDAEFVQLQVNYMDWDNPSFRERECVEIAHEAGLPIIVMEPVKGGILANPPEAVRAVFDEEMPQWSYSAAALRFSASAPGVATTLSGMNALEQVKDNCAAFFPFEPLTEAEQQTMVRVQEALHGADIVPCTGCNYCAKVCPADIGISGSLTGLNYYINTKDPVVAKKQMIFIVGFTDAKKMITECLGCAACEEACPQNLPILEYFDRIREEILSVEATSTVLMK